ncbi:MAG: carbon starvation protein A [Bacilli bacterium]
MSLVLVLGSIVAFVVAYVSYGAWLCKKWGVDPSRETPAHYKSDGVDYVPASAGVVLGHHFASIAGAGPITGPIIAAMFGWLPVYLWIIVGSIFFGGVHDFGSLFASLRHDGKSIGQIISTTMGESGKRLFSIFAWLTLLLVEAAFISIVVGTFIDIPAVATTSMLFIIVAVIFGYLTNRLNVNSLIATIIGLVGVAASIYIGTRFGINLSTTTWTIIILAYIFIASVTPVWILLQPRDYLNSFLLYAMLAGAIIGLLFYRPDIELPAYTGFNINGNYLFPILFVTVACGAISGFHSLVGSGTTAKQLNSEKDAKLVGYGAMLIEGVLAVIALITVSYVAKGTFATGTAPTVIFADGVGEFMTKIGIPKEFGVTFISLSVSAFALTSLDTATRLGRFIFQEFFENKKGADNKDSMLSNKYVATTITVLAGGLLCVAGWQKVWPIFGSANQLLAALALLVLAVWLKQTGRDNKMIIIPMVFMVLVTMFALVLLVKSNLITMMSNGIESGGMILVVLSTGLFILALIFIKYAYGALFNSKKA